MAENARNASRIWKGMLAGAAAGFVASVVMDQFEMLTNRVLDQNPYREDGQESGPVEAAESVSEKALGHPLNPQQRRIVRYALGAASGALYGALAEVSPGGPTGSSAIGSALWLIADELVAPKLGLKKPPSMHQPAGPAAEAASHAVYSWTSSAIRGLVMKAL